MSSSDVDCASEREESDSELSGFGDGTSREKRGDRRGTWHDSASDSSPSVSDVGSLGDVGATGGGGGEDPANRGDRRGDAASRDGDGG